MSMYKSMKIISNALKLLESLDFTPIQLF